MLSSLKNIMTSAAFGVIGGLIGSGLTYISASKTLEIEYTKQISEILPKIYSNDYPTRKAATTALGSYGEKAIPILLTLIADSDDSIKLVAAEALKNNNNKASNQLKDMVLNTQLELPQRSSALYALGYMQDSSVQKIAESIWTDKSNYNSSMLKRNAILALAFLRDKNNIPIFLSIINNEYYRDSDLLGVAIYGYGFVAKIDDFLKNVSPHVISANSGVREYIKNRLVITPGPQATELLQKIKKIDSIVIPKPRILSKNEIESNAKVIEANYGVWNNAWLANIEYQKALR
jgi:hypothetical protein